MSRTKKFVLGLTATAITLGAGLGAAGAATAATASDSAAPSISGDAVAAHGGHGRGALGDNDRAAVLATALGVDEADLSAALEEFRDANRAATRDEGTDRGDRREALAAFLAESLDLDVDDVTAAFDEIRADRIAAMKERAAARTP